MARRPTEKQWADAAERLRTMGAGLLIVFLPDLGSQLHPWPVNQDNAPWGDDGVWFWTRPEDADLTQEEARRALETAVTSHLRQMRERAHELRREARGLSRAPSKTLIARTTSDIARAARQPAPDTYYALRYPSLEATRVVGRRPPGPSIHDLDGDEIAVPLIARDGLSAKAWRDMLREMLEGEIERKQKGYDSESEELLERAKWIERFLFEPPSGWGYGSHAELAAYLGDKTRREALNAQLRNLSDTLRSFAANADAIEWISPDPDTGKELKDSAWSAIPLTAPSPAEADWWPSGGPTWDGLARVTGRDGRLGAIFLEAKGRPSEMRARGLKAKSTASITKILSALEEAKSGLGVDARKDWTGSIYQPANRLAWLWFARDHRTHVDQPLDVWLVSVFFCGIAYKNLAAELGPPDKKAWEPHITKLHSDLGFADGLPAQVSDRWIEVFLPSVVGQDPVE